VNEWIKMRCGLDRHPKVARLADAVTGALGVRTLAHRARTAIVVGLLHRTWSLADAHTTDGLLEGYTPEALDDEIGCPGWSAALVEVGWLEVSGKGIALPGFLTHNGQSAKRRDSEAKRMRATRPSRAAGSQEVRSDANPRCADVRTLSSSSSMSSSISLSEEGESEREMPDEPPSAPVRRAKRATCTLREHLEELEFALLPSSVVDAAERWSASRRKRRLGAWGPEQWQPHLRRALADPAAFEEAVRTSIENRWQGLFPRSGQRPRGQTAQELAAVARSLEAKLASEGGAR
jgi:hypothetical protein